ncbi:Fic family protein [Xanthobacter oligotrophicus]|uniref:Fic family protein n=1 Tax=Xanthobacter oligotrophicus TaxID=2607286 RepID=UPI001AEE9218|nr:Fic family protein [Xanthobacter oligotrophicus]MCG5235369.1 Fic family protein [Xanthobacter oligotrophicus]
MTRSSQEHGGGRGVRDEGLLETALDGPKNRYHYMQQDDAAGARVSASDVAALAAAYAFGIAKNHPFVDDNKRTSFVVCELCELRSSRLLLHTPAEPVRFHVHPPSSPRSACERRRLTI